MIEWGKSASGWAQLSVGSSGASARMRCSGEMPRKSSDQSCWSCIRPSRSGPRAGGDPRTAAKFVFQLPGGPAGVADEGADDAAGPVGVGDGGLRGKPDGPAQTLFFAPPERGKRELVVRDRAAMVDCELLQRGKFLALQEIAHGFSRRLIQDQAKGTGHPRRVRRAGSPSDGRCHPATTDPRAAACPWSWIGRSEWNGASATDEILVRAPRFANRRLRKI